MQAAGSYILVIRDCSRSIAGSERKAVASDNA